MWILARFDLGFTKRRDETAACANKEDGKENRTVPSLGALHQMLEIRAKQRTYYFPQSPKPCFAVPTLLQQVIAYPYLLSCVRIE